MKKSRPKRPRLGSAPRVTVRLRPELERKLRAHAAASGTSPSTIIRAGVLRMIDGDLAGGGN